MPKIVDHEAYRLELLEQCFHLFARVGYANVSMRQIGIELGVSTGTLYHYFPNKQTLFKQMYIAISQRGMAQMTEAIGENAPLTDRLDALFNYVRENEADIRNIIFLTFDFYRLRQQDEDDGFIHETMDYIQESTRAVAGLSPELSLLLFSAVDGLIMQRFLGGEPVDLEAQFRLLHQLIIKQVGG